MRICIRTRVNGNYKEIFEQFDENLFRALQPKFPKTVIKRFDGSRKGDIVRVDFRYPRMAWISRIIASEIKDNSAFFIDEGVVIPLGIKTWKHTHWVNKKSNNTSEIVDEIEFTTSFFLLTLVLFPALYLSFYSRKPIYKQYFRPICRPKQSQL